MTMTFYMIQAQRVFMNPSSGYTKSTQAPTFYLDADQLGITSPEQATKIASEILACGRNERLHIHAVRVRKHSFVKEEKPYTVGVTKASWKDERPNMQNLPRSK